MLIHINGMPGTGKLTVARLIGERLRARVVDNHAIIDQVTPEHPRDSSTYVPAVVAAMTKFLATYQDKVVVFTNAFAAEIESDRERFHQIAEAADHRGVPLIQILLVCSAQENARRVASEDRGQRGKLRDPEALSTLRSRYTMYHPPSPRRLELDTTALSADEAAERIVAFIQRSGPVTQI